MLRKRLHTVHVDDNFQKNYSYLLTEPRGKNFHPEFKPELTPKAMLKLGVFGGSYFQDRPKELPRNWFDGVKFSLNTPDASLNYFKVNASQPLKIWIEKKWIYWEDPRGWFQWYCRYFLGRRIPGEDLRQIKRWRGIKRHIKAVQKNCRKCDLKCRPRQRQAILHWAYDSRNI